MAQRKGLRAGLYLRISTDGQSTENQRRELEAVAAREGWQIVEVFEDRGISGAKGRDKRPAFDRMLKDVSRGKIDLVAAWSVDRLGRSLLDLINMLGELHAKRVELYLHQQGIDTTTPSGKAMFQMMGVFAEFERAMIVERVNAGLARARASGIKLGRGNRKSGERSKDEQRWKQSRHQLVKRIRNLHKGGTGILKIARTLKVGTSTVQRALRA